MKIALAASSCDNRTGIGRVVKNLAHCFLAAGHTVDVIAQHIDAPGGTFNSVRLLSVPGSRALSHLLYNVRSRAVFGRGNYDVTNSFGVGRGAMIVTAQSCHRAGVELQSRYRRGRVAPGNRGIFDRIALTQERERMTARSTRLIIAVSSLVRDQLIGYYGIPPEKIRIIPNGVDLPLFSRLLPLGERQAIRREMNCGDEDFCLLLVGNEFDRKGLQTVIEAMRVMSDPKIKLAVIGGDDPSPFRARAAALGVEKQVTYLGEVDGAERYFGAGDALVLPAWYEPFGIVIPEAMASGLPVITSASAGGVEHMAQGRHGLFLEDPLSATELASAIVRLRHDPGLRSVLAANGREEAKRFSWQTVADSTLAAYRSVLDSGGGGGE